MLRIAILGSTGSIGCSALSVAMVHPDRVEVVGLAAGANVSRFAEQVEHHRPRVIAMAAEDGLASVLSRLSEMTRGSVERSLAGPEGLVAVATDPDVDLVLCATTGTTALDAVFAAIDAGKTIALANKEVLVMAGGLVMEAARRRGVSVIPVDSEHNAIHQCLHGRSDDEIKRLILTASGGPFREWSRERLAGVTPADALEHPTWRMGRKITVDSATLMNKGLEVIEARWLFGVAAERIDVVVHPQSVVHSLVELRDGSQIAQLGVTDMRLPIQYAFSYPDRWDTELPALDLAACGRLDFGRPDMERFPCLALAYRALDGGAALPVALNAANEVAVEAFLDEAVPFSAIPIVIAAALDHADADARDVSRGGSLTTLDDVRRVDASARAFSRTLVDELQSQG
ncbi:MAG: 1-deoxy-D-xylulose-5-phosphate reductoisomerase [Acidobacteria bacterium]|jgi:1-deoxy-D-xylulose-5-phosphate reductoisomerase|nr:1-deoxy-D-xylulose-5-phosphate reductoisomerase [Acidobacteriota bacterium]MDP7338472.1 1-deoxy-D-xylulose-5-phosphate reductoisomerase [Vicinamibacterales bacterium]MDP7479086.1 1-deoxy-D-xylulose-5-phosphate reductoisomerase [Vicinamibacterales bacterium]MDP7691408.1 1-deoxy-D-xylulose-5-phosphate reductoisomerase [Vicinamibacterales bacterium]HJN45590.1 1-deoxy-D-xylulose-5-phosphate reductoisomerase [Vicinamibacterales bacterium]|tara:strand:- start:2875 stop:4077 length:1203 start_codon:yes stop_codon:yes gene_type:complete